MALVELDVGQLATLISAGAHGIVLALNGKAMPMSKADLVEHLRQMSDLASHLPDDPKPVPGEPAALEPVPNDRAEAPPA
jgi:hypothetical protein